MIPRPRRIPRTAAWILARTIPEHRREEFLGDLEELFLSRANAVGAAAAARRWYWRQTAAALLDAFAEWRRQPRERNGDSVVLTILQDLRYAFRSLTAKPGFAVVAILMLALGIGANVTIFSWVNAVLLNPLPGTTRSQELVQLSYLLRGEPLPSFSYLDYRDIREASRLLQGVAGRDDLAVGIVIDREAERAWAEIVTANFFDVLGVGAVAGRTLTPADDVPGAPAVVVISHDYWKSRFNADPHVIGRQIRDQLSAVHDRRRRQSGFQGGESGLSYDLLGTVGTQPLMMPGGDRLEVRGSRWLSLLGGSHRERRSIRFARSWTHHRRHARGLRQPEPLHRTSRGRLPAGPVSNRRRQRAPAGPADLDGRRHRRAADRVRQPGGTPSGARDSAAT